MSAMANTGENGIEGSCDGADRISDLQDSVKRIEVSGVSTACFRFFSAGFFLGFPLGFHLGFPSVFIRFPVAFPWVVGWAGLGRCWVGASVGRGRGESHSF